MEICIQTGINIFSIRAKNTTNAIKVAERIEKKECKRESFIEDPRLYEEIKR
jgi:hypothetical protein